MSSFIKCSIILNIILLCNLSLTLSETPFGPAMTTNLNKFDNFRLYFVTWNVADKDPEQDLHSLLNLTTNHEKDVKLPDMYIIGLQEVRSQPQDLIMNMFTYDPWTVRFSEILKKYDYVKIDTMKLQGIIINVFCLRKHITNLRLIESMFTKTGFYGYWGNKGAVSTRMNLYGINICFVNAHLPPHDNALKTRINDYTKIIKTHTYENPETKHILFHDYVFWIGDLNFRLNEGISAADIDVLVKKNDLETLLKKDQLLSVINSHEAFSGFQEEKITFPPTFKYKFNSQDFDYKRRPSWTDRILYKINNDSYGDNALNIVQYNYKSHPSYVQSDHKPVTAEIDINVRTNYVHQGVELIVPVWYLDKQNTVFYKFLGGYIPNANDYIALYYDNFSSIEDYICYEYVTISETVEEHSNEKRMYFGLAISKNPGLYRLIYFGKKDGALSILGISCTFQINEGEHLITQSCN